MHERKSDGRVIIMLEIGRKPREGDIARQL